MKTNNKASNNKRLCISALLISVLLAGVMTQVPTGTINFGATDNPYYLNLLSSIQIKDAATTTPGNRSGTDAISFLPLDAGFKLYVGTTDLDAGTAAETAATEKYRINAFSTSLGSIAADATNNIDSEFPAGTLGTVVQDTSGEYFFVNYTTVQDSGSKHKLTLVDKNLAATKVGYVISGVDTAPPDYMFPFVNGFFLVATGETLLRFEIATMPDDSTIANYAAYSANPGVTSLGVCTGCNYYAPAMNAGTLDRIVTRQGNTLTIRDPTALGTAVHFKAGFDIAAKTVINQGTNSLIVFDPIAKIYVWDWAANLANSSTGFTEINLQETFGNMFYLIESMISTSDMKGHILVRETNATGKRGVFAYDLLGNNTIMNEVNSIASSGSTATFEFAVAGVTGDEASIMAVISSTGNLFYYSASCNETCLTCDVKLDGSRCLTCSNSSHFLTQATGQSYGTCEGNCTAGTFGHPITKICTNCNGVGGGGGACSECFGAADNCTACVNTAEFAYEGACISSCALGTFVQDSPKSCVDCNETCATCDGPDGNSCLTCATPGYVIQPASGTTVPGACQATCNSTFFPDSNTPKVCTSCHSTCGTCRDVDADNTGDAEECTTCVDNTYVLQPATALQDYGTCILKTTGCNAGFYEGVRNGIAYCYACHSSCTTCFGPTANECDTCTTTILKQNNFTTGTNTFARNRSVDDASNCQTGSLRNRECLGSCVAAGSTNCGDGFFENSTTCVPCQAGCRTCTDATTCTACYSNYFTRAASAGPPPLSLTCHLNCSAITDNAGNSYFNDASTPASPLCTLCDTSCDTCTGPGASDCIKCRTGLSPDTQNLSPDGRCLENCPAGYFNGPSINPQPNNCLVCDSSCFTCVGAASSNCTACKGSLLINRTLSTDTQFACIDSCPTGKYIDVALQECKLCYDPLTSANSNTIANFNCSECTGKTPATCTKCGDQHLIKNPGTATASCHPCGIAADFATETNFCQFDSSTKSFVGWSITALDRTTQALGDINSKLLFKLDLTFRATTESTDYLITNMNTAELKKLIQITAWTTPSAPSLPTTTGINFISADLATQSITFSVDLPAALTGVVDLSKSITFGNVENAAPESKFKIVGITGGTINFYMVEDTPAAISYGYLCLPYDVEVTSNCHPCHDQTNFLANTNACKAPNDYSYIGWTVAENRISYFDTDNNKKFHFRMQLNYKASSDFSTWAAALNDANLQASMNVATNITATPTLVFDNWDSSTSTINFHLLFTTAVTSDFEATFTREQGTLAAGALEVSAGRLIDGATVDYYLTSQSVVSSVEKFCEITENRRSPDGTCVVCNTEAGYNAEPSTCRDNPMKSFMLWNVTDKAVKYTDSRQNKVFEFNIEMTYKKTPFIDGFIFGSLTTLENQINVSTSTAATNAPTLTVLNTTDTAVGANVSVSVSFPNAIPEDIAISFQTDLTDSAGDVFHNDTSNRYLLVNKTQNITVERDCDGILLRLSDATCFNCTLASNFASKATECKTTEPFKSFVNWSPSVKSVTYAFNDTDANTVYPVDIVVDYNAQSLISNYFARIRTLNGKIKTSSGISGVLTIQGFTASNNSLQGTWTFDQTITEDTTVTLEPFDKEALELVSDATSAYYMVDKSVTLTMPFQTLTAPVVNTDVPTPKPFEYEVLGSETLSDGVKATTKIVSGASAVLSVGAMPLSVATVPLVAGPVSSIQAFGKMAFLPVDTGKTMGTFLYTLDDSTVPQNGNYDGFIAASDDDSTAGRVFVNEKDLSNEDLGVTGTTTTSTAATTNSTSNSTSNGTSRVLQTAQTVDLTPSTEKKDEFQTESVYIVRSSPILALGLIIVAFVNGILYFVFQLRRHNPLMKILSGIEHLIMVFGLVELAFCTTLALAYDWEVDSRMIINKLIAGFLYLYYFFRLFRLFKTASNFPMMTYNAKQKKGIEIAIIGANMNHDKLLNKPVRFYHVFTLIKLFVAMALIVMLQKQATICLIVNFLLFASGLGYYGFITGNFKPWANTFALVIHALIEVTCFLIALTALILSFTDDVDSGIGNILQYLVVIVGLITIIALLVFMVYSIITLLMKTKNPNRVEQVSQNNYPRQNKAPISQKPQDNSKMGGFDQVGGNSNRGQINVNENEENKKNIVRKDLDEEAQEQEEKKEYK